MKLRITIYWLTGLFVSTISYGQSTTHVEQINTLLRNPDHQVLVAAHRGDWRNAPENSLQAIQNCIDMGVDIVEVDVRKTSDGQLILMHDETLNRTTNGVGNVADWSLDSIKTLHLKNGIAGVTDHSIPTLKEALQLAQGKLLLYLDKTLSLMPETLQLLDEMQVLDQVIFMHPIKREEAEKLFGIYYLPRVNFIARIELDEENPRQFIDQYIAAQYRPLAIQLRLASETTGQVELIDYIQQHNFRVCVSTLWAPVSAGHSDDQAVHNPDAHWGWHIRQGVTIINTDRPQSLLSYLRGKKLHP